MTWDEEAKEILNDFTTKELIDEIKSRKYVKLHPYEVIAYFECPKCTSQDQVDFYGFDLDDRLEHVCGECGANLKIIV